MKLGNYVEILNPASAAGEAFYTQLGYQALGDGLFTDGSLNMRLRAGLTTVPTLHYMGGDLAALAGLGLTLTQHDGAVSFTGAGGLHVIVSAAASSAPMPAGDALNRKPISRLGKFGEFALNIDDDFEAAAQFWEKLGFERLHSSNEPQPWGIFTDGMIVLGLHVYGEEKQETPTITYFAGDMPARIKQLMADGLAVQALFPLPDGTIEHGLMRSPDGQPIFIFTGEI
ncbi:MAG: hypothetical protein JNJ61_13690 [Anaerolineae bacterium]|nr:hypothetical protein [Anaerolineae bacterium]